MNNGTNRKEVIATAGKKIPCGCGCILLKQNSTKATRDRDAKKSK